jgi:hypothetical protein
VVVKAVCDAINCRFDHGDTPVGCWSSHTSKF